MEVTHAIDKSRSYMEPFDQEVSYTYCGIHMCRTVSGDWIDYDVYAERNGALTVVVDEEPTCFVCRNGIPDITNVEKMVYGDIGLDLL